MARESNLGPTPIHFEDDFNWLWLWLWLLLVAALMKVESEAAAGEDFLADRRRRPPRLDASWR